MAGLLAWASDVVGRGGKSDEDNDPDSIPVIFTPDQQSYALQLDIKSAALSRSIQDLRLRLPPPDISQRLPDLHAHSLASNAALALQLNAHSTTKEQTQLREVTLQEENAEYEKDISNCENKIQEKLQEADMLQSKLKELELIEENLKSELRSAEVADATKDSSESITEHKRTVKSQEDAEVSKYELLDKLESKRKEMDNMEEAVRHLEKKWAAIQENALKQPSPVQREKILDKQLHSLIEQLEAKQAQAEGLVGEIRMKEMELEKLEGLRRRAEASNNTNLNTGRSRLGRSSFGKEPVSADYIVDPHSKPPFARNENLQRLMLLRSAFVLYILALHVLVFIKISF